MIAGFAAQGLQYGSALLLVPLLATRLTPAELGLWYLFVAIQGLVLVVEYGVQGSFARNISLAFSGVSELRREGIGAGGSGTPNHLLVARTVHVAKRLYLGIAGVLLTVLLVAGSPYVMLLAKRGGMDMRHVELCWWMMCLGSCLMIYQRWINPLLIGAGRIEQNYIYTIVSRGGFTLLAAAALLAGGGILALTVAQLASVILAGGAGLLLLRPVVRDLPRVDHRRDETRELLRITWHGASRLGLTGIAGFLIIRSSVFAISSFMGLEVAASYSLTLQLLYAVSQIAQLPMQYALPRIVERSVGGDRRAIWQLARALIGVFAGLYMIGATMVALGGAWLLPLIGSHVALLPWPQLLLLAVVLLLDGINWTSCFVLLNGNRVPFARAAIVSAIVIAGGSFAVGWAQWGVTAIIAVQGLVQLAYNNWRWPLLLYREAQG